MAHTQIPPPRDRQDRIDDFVRQDERRYIVEVARTGKVIGANLSRWELMEFVWTYGGRDYRIEPRIGVVLDDIGRSTGVTYQLADLFGLEWDVYFKNGGDQPWRKSRITAYGPSEREAVLNLLDDGFKKAAWDDDFYVWMWGLTDLRKLGLVSSPPSSSDKRAAIGVY
jgi:hypothetical protein